MSIRGYKSGVKCACISNSLIIQEPGKQLWNIEKRRLKMQSAIALFFALVIMGASANRIQWARLLAQLQDDLELPVVDQKEPKTLASATRANGSSYQVIMQELGMRYVHSTV